MTGTTKPGKELVEKVLKKPTRTLDEYQAERLAFWESGKQFKGDKLDIRCPKKGCTGQLVCKSHNPNMTTFPPQKTAHCSKCSFSTRVYV